MLRGHKRKIPKITVPVSASLHNRFDIEVVDASTGKVKQRAQAENVICTGLWTKLFTPATYFNYIHYGTGSGTPASSDTSLFTFLSYKTPSTSDDVYTDSPENGYCYLTRKVIINPEDNVGSTITEVGIAYGTSSTNLCTHAMLKDMNGNEISIEKASTDLINIYATVYIHWNNSALQAKGIYLYPRTGTMLNVFLGMYNVSNYYRSPNYAQGSYGLTSNSSYSTFLTISVSSAYSSAAKTLTLTASRISADQYNFSGIFSINFFTYSYKSVLHGPALSLLAEGKEWFAGASITGESIGTGDGATTDFQTVFPDPENTTIYVNGIEEVNVTVDQTFTGTDIGKYFRGIDAASTVSNLMYSATPGALDGGNYDFNPYYYYNPYYSIGVAYMTLYGIGSIEVSNDLSTWESFTLPANDYSHAVLTIPSGYENYKYWKITYGASGNNGHYVRLVTPPSSFTGYNIHFTTPPASGAVITADYTTKAIAKDANHVFDVSVVITLGEYNQ